VEVANAFIGKPTKPSEKELVAVLSSSAPAWTELIRWMSEQGASAQEWKSSGAKYGWSLRLKRKDRNIVYLSPCNGCFRVSFVLGDRAMEAAHHAAFSPAVAQLIAESPRYPEGTGIRLTVHQPRDLAPIRMLAAIKLAD
jgi:Protein of unknown function (DUF3788)